MPVARLPIRFRLLPRPRKVAETFGIHCVHKTALDGLTGRQNYESPNPKGCQAAFRP